MVNLLLLSLPSASRQHQRLAGRASLRHLAKLQYSAPQPQALASHPRLSANPLSLALRLANLRLRVLSEPRNNQQQQITPSVSHWLPQLPPHSETHQLRRIPAHLEDRQHKTLPLPLVSRRYLELLRDSHRLQQHLPIHLLSRLRLRPEVPLASHQLRHRTLSAREGLLLLINQFPRLVNLLALLILCNHLQVQQPTGQMSDRQADKERMVSKSKEIHRI